ncbi:MAG: hypothetical protein LBE15_06450 [Burkholderiales bacterium]|jgi:hypothetical protein|nr:hypothetical protein [Burkholderiales bacterium]
MTYANALIFQDGRLKTRQKKPGSTLLAAFPQGGKGYLPEHVSSLVYVCGQIKTAI